MKNRKNYLKSRAKFRRLLNYGSVFETGFVCEICGGMLYDFPTYDAKGCIACDRWAEDVCGDPNCPVCSKRPESPWYVVFDANEAVSRRRVVYRAMERKRYLQDNYFHKTSGAVRRRKKRKVSVKMDK